MNFQKESPLHDFKTLKNHCSILDIVEIRVKWDAIGTSES